MKKQKNSTTKKKRTRRSKVKNPALKKEYNLKLRQDYIEPDYIDGVYDNETGELVIRPMNEEEVAWLNNFYEEYINANFLRDPELRRLHEQIKELGQKKDPTKEDKEQLSYLYLCFFEAQDRILLFKTEKQQKKIYGENNARNRDIFNRARAMDNLYSYKDDLEDFENIDDDCTNYCF